MGMIISILDIDLYKLTVLQLFFHKFRNAKGRYAFTCRNRNDVDMLKYVPEDSLRGALGDLDNLRLRPEQADYLRSTGHFQEDFIQFLIYFRFKTQLDLTIIRDEQNRTYTIEAAGNLVNIVLYETLVLSIVNEIFEMGYTWREGTSVYTGEETRAFGFGRLKEKCDRLLGYNEECRAGGFQVPQIIEMGTRRRFSHEWQRCVLNHLQKNIPDNLVGTSNVELAQIFGIKPIGTFGHELIMAMQGFYPAHESQVKGFWHWQEEYKGKLGIALSDTLGDPKFFRDFGLRLATAFDGVRHDSGDPFVYGERVIAMYQKLGIDPTTKRIIFSDGLNIDIVIELHRHFRGRIGLAFGIGTDLTNDCGNPVLHIVMKIVECNGIPVVKLSANPAKGSCIDPIVLQYVQQVAEKY